MAQVRMLREVESTLLGTLKEGKTYDLFSSTALALVSGGRAVLLEKKVEEEKLPKPCGLLAPSTSVSQVGQVYQKQTAKPSESGGTLKLKKRGG